ncbi:MAG: diguanylate cyclase [Defluviitaleaceae bacterium]|nr:diguanylate cyclase [Defluviitaleaceae bacterium]MCL2239870.1 diguanylate cyclase [Defluviitaleaceae bacterium]
MKNPIAAIKERFKKTDIRNLLGDIAGVLDPLDFEILVVRRRCEVLFTNERAKTRMYTESGYTHDCRTSYAATFPALCSHCPYGVTRVKAVEGVFEIEDARGQTYQVRCNAINWIDDMPAFIFTMHDITEEIAIKKRLYELAYIDQLTLAPNRTKLKENFNALEEQIAKEEITGVLALFDLDHFKAVNDTYGHNTGDIVLRRLVEHLESESQFTGHLYRLGGDEFVLLYNDPASRFDSEESLIKHYDNILSTALRSYSLPNIDLNCTLSMGVSVFPRDGSTLSEILRKADIALYAAKDGGRNQLCFFVSQYDTAQKFKDVYINIQPVLTSVGKTFGYELMDCSEDEELDGAVDLKDFNRTLDAMGLHNLEDKFHYFIAYSKQLLNPAVLVNLPRDKFIVQINPPRSKHMQVYHELKNHGYKLAITNLSSHAPDAELLDLADYAMFSPKDGDISKQRKIIATHYDKRFVAIGVDTQADYEEAKKAGFQLFKGFYFRQPPIGQKSKEINPLKINYLRLMKLSNTEGYMDFPQISAIIASDVALSYKLLRILNSAAVGLRNVTSINSAIAYLGEDNLKKWIAVLALRGAAEDKPIELIRLSLIRAHFGELLAPCFRIRRSPQKLFMIGMLSLLHIALDTTREELMKDMPVEEDIRGSLLSKTGVYSDILNFFENYEYANWEAVAQFVEKHQMDASYVNDAYIASVKWYNDLIEEAE